MALTVVDDTRRLVLGGDPRALAAIPPDSMFEDNDGAKFLPCFEGREIGEALRNERPELEFLAPVRIEYVWKCKGGESGGYKKLGACSKASGLVAFYSGADFIIWFGADNCRDARLTNWQFEALVYHELLHADLDADHGTPTVRGHDLEMFRAEVERYGLWKPDLQAASEVFVQLELGTR